MLPLILTPFISYNCLSFKQDTPLLHLLMTMLWQRRATAAINQNHM